MKLLSLENLVEIRYVSLEAIPEMREIYWIQTDTLPAFLSSKHYVEHSWVPLLHLGCRAVIWTVFVLLVRTDAVQVPTQHCLCICSANLLAVRDEQSAYWPSQQLLAPPPSPHVDPHLVSACCSFFPIKERGTEKLAILFPSPKMQFSLSWPVIYSLFLVIPSGIWKMLPNS